MPPTNATPKLVPIMGPLKPDAATPFVFLPMFAAQTTGTGAEKVTKIIPRYLFAKETPEGLRLVIRPSRKRTTRPVWVPHAGLNSLTDSVAKVTRSRIWSVSGYAVTEKDGSYSIPEKAESLVLASWKSGLTRATDAQTQELLDRRKVNDGVMADLVRLEDQQYQARRAAMGMVPVSFQPAHGAAPVQADPEPESPAGPPPLPPRPEAELYHYEDMGPLSGGEIAELMQEDDRHLVWQKGYEGWTPASEVPALVALAEALADDTPPVLPEKSEAVADDTADAVASDKTAEVAQ